MELWEGGMAKLDVDPDEELPGPYGARGKGWDGYKASTQVVIPSSASSLLLCFGRSELEESGGVSENLVTGGVSLMHSLGFYDALECVLCK